MSEIVFGPPPGNPISDEERRELLLDHLRWTLGHVREFLEDAEKTLAKLTDLGQP